MGGELRSTNGRISPIRPAKKGEQFGSKKAGQTATTSGQAVSLRQTALQESSNPESSMQGPHIKKERHGS